MRERWLNQESCLLPCWEGVTPGETTAAEAYRIWSENDLFEYVDLRDGSKTIEWGMELEDGSVLNGDALIESVHLEDVVYQIRVPFPRTTLAELIVSFGEPSAIAAFRYEPSDGPEQVFFDIFIKWNQGVFFEISGEYPPPDIRPDMILVRAYYFPGQVDKAIEDSLINIEDYMVPWHGFDRFGNYSTQK